MDDLLADAHRLGLRGGDLFRLRRVDHGIKGLAELGAVAIQGVALSRVASSADMLVDIRDGRLVRMLIVLEMAPRRTAGRPPSCGCATPPTGSAGHACRIVGAIEDGVMLALR